MANGGIVVKLPKLKQIIPATRINLKSGLKAKVIEPRKNESL